MNSADKMTNISRWRQRVLAAAVMLLGVVVLAAVVTFLSLQYIPRWYAPPSLTADDLPRIRATLPAAFEEFSRRLVAGKTFDFTLVADTINEWIAARTTIWPDARDALPTNLREPVVVFDNGLATVGATVINGTLRAIVSSGVSVTVAGDTIELRLANTAVGGLSLSPAWLTSVVDLPVDDELEHLVQNASDTVQFIDDATPNRSIVQRLANGIRVQNRFLWPNGKRWFRIRDIRLATGRLTLTVQPL